MKKSSKLLKRASDLNREEKEKTSTLTAVTMAQHVMKLEDFLDRHETYRYLHENALSTMCDQIERLRPPKDEMKLKEMKDQILQVIP